MIVMTVEQREAALFLLGTYNLRDSRGRIAVDNIPGPALTAAIRAAQTGLEIPVDGTWGPQTEAAVLEAVGKGQRIEPPAPAERPDRREVEDTVWAYLMDKGLPAVAAAGIMGNLNAESAMRPDNLEDYYQARLGYTDESYTQAVDSGAYQRFARDSAGYGLCQWTWWERKNNLLTAAKAAGKSIADIGVQLDFLWKELRHMGLIPRLEAAGSAYEATRLFMVVFENPADQSDTAIARRAQISQQYMARYNGRM